MTDSGFELGLDDATRAGVFFVTHDDIDTLAAAGRDASLLAARIDLSGCINKATMMLRFATALDFPSGSGCNWDALSDALRDLGWLPANQGFVLLLEHAGDLRGADENSFETLLDVLDEASSFWAEQSTPLWAFIALPEQDFGELS